MAAAMAKADAMLAAAEAKAMAKYAPKEEPKAPPAKSSGGSSVTIAPVPVQPAHEQKALADARMAEANARPNDPGARHAAMAAAAAAQVEMECAPSAVPSAAPSKPKVARPGSAKANARPGSAKGRASAPVQISDEEEGYGDDVFDDDDGDDDDDVHIHSQLQAATEPVGASITIDDLHNAVAIYQPPEGAQPTGMPTHAAPSQPPQPAAPPPAAPVAQKKKPVRPGSAMPKRTEPPSSAYAATPQPSAASTRPSTAAAHKATSAMGSAVPAMAYQPAGAAAACSSVGEEGEEPLEMAVAAALGVPMQPRVLTEQEQLMGTMDMGMSGHAPGNADTATITVRKGRKGRPQSAAHARPGTAAGGRAGGGDRAPSPRALAPLSEDANLLENILGPLPDGGYEDTLSGPYTGGLRAQSAGARRTRKGGRAQSASHERTVSPPAGGFEAGGAYTELLDFGTGAALPAAQPRKRRARSARASGRMGSPPPEAIAPAGPKGTGGYLVGLRNYRDDLNPYLAEPMPQVAPKPKAKVGNVKLGKIGGGGKEGVGAVAAQMMHEQQLRILASLYGAPLRCFGMPATSAPPAEGVALPAGANPKAGRGPPAGTGVAVVKAARESSTTASGAENAAPTVELL